NYSVRSNFTAEPLMEVERAASGLFGFLQYGVHINGFTRGPDGEMKMWIGRRSKTKQTFPDMFDNMCAGGLAAGMGILECAKKECQEEASVSDKLLERLKPVGCVSYFYEDERGLQPESQFVFDLELPDDFTPVNADGEMGSFQHLTIPEVI
ncbi:nudix hydrolase 20, chloroplastic-like, partial [Plakobranchus ocellatus]